MHKKIVILTGNELRHQYFKKKISLDARLEVIATYCEREENILEKGANQQDIKKRHRHILARQQSEKDFFEEFVQITEDRSNSMIINRGEINLQQHVDSMVSSNPDHIIVYGASILKEDLLSHFPGKILNVHLGLSPYYRGSATNFWPLVDEVPECVGATFMYIDKGIDTGQIIHQIRAPYMYGDTPSTVGNRLINLMTSTYRDIIFSVDKLSVSDIPSFNSLRKFCRKKDFTEEAVGRVYKNFCSGMIEEYLDNKDARDSLFPLVQNRMLSTF